VPSTASAAATSSSHEAHRPRPTSKSCVHKLFPCKCPIVKEGRGPVI
jgi:hypothetical protein